MSFDVEAWKELIEGLWAYFAAFTIAVFITFYALYKAKKNNHKVWFWILLADFILISVLFSVGAGAVLPIIYLIYSFIKRVKIT